MKYFFLFNKTIRTSILLLIGIVSACSDFPDPLVTDEIEANYWELRANYQTVQLSAESPYDTLTVSVTPYSANGEALDMQLLSPNKKVFLKWMSKDSSKVRVSQDGYINAIAEANRIELIASLTIGRVTKSTSVLVRIKNNGSPQRLSMLDIVPKDSLKRAVSNIIPYMLQGVARDSNGIAISDAPIFWSTSNVKIAKFSSPELGFLGINARAPFWIYAQSYYYGIFVKDSFILDVGYPVEFPFLGTKIIQRADSDLKVNLVPINSRPRIGPGGRVYFENTTAFGPKNILGVGPISGSAIDVIFDDPSAALGAGESTADTMGISGNIMSLPMDTTLSSYDRRAYRRFVKPGEYFYTIAPYGVRGSIIIEAK